MVETFDKSLDNVLTIPANVSKLLCVPWASALTLLICVCASDFKLATHRQVGLEISFSVVKQPLFILKLSTVAIPIQCSSNST